MILRDTVAVFDLDGTLARCDTYVRYLLGALRERPHRLPRTVGLPLDVVRFRCGWRDNTWLKKRFLGAILGGLTEEDLAAWTRRFLDELAATGLRRAGLETLRTHQSEAHHTILLSASPDFFVRAIAARLGFAECICTVATRDAAGRLTGDLEGGNCYGPDKVLRLERRFAGERDRVRIIAYGDHRSDLPLLRWADEGVLVNPAPALAREAQRLRLRVVSW